MAKNGTSIEAVVEFNGNGTEEAAKVAKAIADRVAQHAESNRLPIAVAGTRGSGVPDADVSADQPSSPPQITPNNLRRLLVDAEIEKERRQADRIADALDDLRLGVERVAEALGLDVNRCVEPGETLIDVVERTAREMSTPSAMPSQLELAEHVTIAGRPWSADAVRNALWAIADMAAEEVLHDSAKKLLRRYCVIWRRESGERRTPNDLLNDFLDAVRCLDRRDADSAVRSVLRIGLGVDEAVMTYGFKADRTPMRFGGHVYREGGDPQVAEPSPIDQMRREAARLGIRIHDSAGRTVDELAEDLAVERDAHNKTRARLRALERVEEDAHHEAAGDQRCAGCGVWLPADATCHLPEDFERCCERCSPNVLAESEWAQGVLAYGERDSTWMRGGVELSNETVRLDDMSGDDVCAAESHAPVDEAAVGFMINALMGGT